MNIAERALCIGGVLDGQWAMIGNRSVLYAERPTELSLSLLGEASPPTATRQIAFRESYRLQSLLFREYGQPIHLWVMDGLDLQDAVEALVTVYAHNFKHKPLRP